MFQCACMPDTVGHYPEFTGFIKLIAHLGALKFAKKLF
jgi:hypothetical protein